MILSTCNFIFLICLFDICILSLVRWSDLLPILKSSYSFFLLLNFKGSLCILDNGSLSDMPFLNILPSLWVDFWFSWPHFFFQGNYKSYWLRKHYKYWEREERGGWGEGILLRTDLLNFSSILFQFKILKS